MAGAARAVALAVQNPLKAGRSTPTEYARLFALRRQSDEGAPIAAPTSMHLRCSRRPARPTWAALGKPFPPPCAEPASLAIITAASPRCTHRHFVDVHPIRPGSARRVAQLTANAARRPLRTRPIHWPSEPERPTIVGLHAFAWLLALCAEGKISALPLRQDVPLQRERDCQDWWLANRSLLSGAQPSSVSLARR